MHISTITSKGQTTIPKEVREFLHLKSNDKIVYITDGKRIVLTPIKGTILNLRGVVKRQNKKKIRFPRLREEVKRKVVKEIVEEMK